MIYIDNPETFGSDIVFPMFERKFVALWFYGEGTVPCCGNADTLNEALGSIYGYIHEAFVSEFEEGVTIKVFGGESEEMIIKLSSRDVNEEGRVIPNSRFIRYITPEEALEMCYEHPEYFRLRNPDTAMFRKIRELMDKKGGSK